MSVTAVYRYIAWSPISKPLSAALREEGLLIEVLSYLTLEDQARCRCICKRDKKAIGEHVRAEAIKQLVQNSRFLSFENFERYSSFYKKFSRKILDPGHLLSLDLSFSADEEDVLDDNDRLQAVQYFSHIRQLRIDCDRELLIEKIAQVATQIHELWITIFDPTEKACAAVAKCENLRYLKLHMSRLCEPQVQDLASLKNLEHLELDVGKFPQEKLMALSSLKSLRHLNVPHCMITDLRTIPNFNQLKYLEFDERPIIDQQMRALYNHPTLETLIIRPCSKATKISERACKELLRIRNLNQVEIGSSIHSRHIHIPCHQRVISWLKKGTDIFLNNPLEIAITAGGVASSGWGFGILSMIAYRIYVRPIFSTPQN